MNPLKIVFAGTPIFAAKIFSALLKTQHSIVGVYTQLDKPAGRGLNLKVSPVKELALQNNIPVFQPDSLKNEVEKLAEFNADVLVVVAYGLILPAAVLTTPKFGCINVHASLLPRWRGAAPIQRAILTGDEKTGVTIMQMDQGLDTGAMLLKKSCSILPTDTSASLHDSLAELGADALIETLNNLQNLKPEIQNQTDATYAAKISKDEAKINWHESVKVIDQKIRAFNPWPVAFTNCGEKIIRIWQAKPITSEKKQIPGTILSTSSKGIEVATGDGILRIEQLQLPGGKSLSAADILNARAKDFSVGTLLG